MKSIKLANLLPYNVLLVAAYLMSTAASGQVQDTTPPTLVAISFSPTSIDVSAGPQTVTLTVRVTDDLSGFQRGFFQLTSPSGGQSLFGSITQLVSGDLHDGTYQTQVTVPQFSEAGLWYFVYVRLDDLANNTVTMFTPALNALGLSPQLTVTGGPDLAPPKLVAVSFSPTSVDVSTGPQTVTLTVGVTDDLSGFQRGFFQLTSPSGGQSLFGSITQLVSGDLHDGIYQTQVTVPQFSEAGPWYFVYVRLDDLANNTVTMFTPDLNTLGLSPTLGVISIPDTTAPKLVAVSFSPTSVDVSTGPQTVTLTVGVTDDLSGFQRGFFQLTSPSGGQSLFGSITQLVSGDLHDGIYQTQVTVPQFSEAGPWYFVYVRLDDLANNTVTMFTPVLVTSGLSPQLTVSVDTTAPETTIASAVDGNGAAVGSGGATLSNSITFTFGGTDDVGVAGFQCRLDGVAYVRCASPAGYSALAIGSHTFEVRALDSAGNIDPSPAAFTWAVVTPAQATQNLITTIGKMGLPAGVANSLTAPLGQVSALLNDNNPNNDIAACGKLDAFINEVNAKSQNGQLTPAQASQLLQAANAIKASLGC